MSIKFSIVLPCYNTEKYIQHAIDSLVKQTYRNYELIIIDGGSSDGTLDILNHNKKHIHVLVSEPDKGQSDALNKGFSLATGDFYMWLNADDMLSPRLLDLAAKYLENNTGCLWLAFNTIFIDKQGIIQRFHHAPPWNEYLNISHRPQVECPTSIFHPSLLLEAGGFDVRLDFTMDLDLWRTFIKNGHKWSRLNYYGYVFRIHNGSKTGKETPTPPSPQQLIQNEIMCRKHNITYKKSSVFLSKILKLIFCLPYSTISRWRWRGFHISEFRD